MSQNKEVSMFEVGELVICVDDEIDRRQVAAYPQYHWVGGMDGLRKGYLYTVRALGTHSVTNRPGLFLEEIVRPIWRSNIEEPFYEARFRPLPSSQISLINSMLVTEPAKERA